VASKKVCWTSGTQCRLSCLPWRVYASSEWRPKKFVGRVGTLQCAPQVAAANLGSLYIVCVLRETSLRFGLLRFTSPPGLQVLSCQGPALGSFFGWSALCLNFLNLFSPFSLFSLISRSWRFGLEEEGLEKEVLVIMTDNDMSYTGMPFLLYATVNPQKALRGYSLVRPWCDLYGCYAMYQNSSTSRALGDTLRLRV
jgi:hypothetical protein